MTRVRATSGQLQPTSRGEATLAAIERGASLSVRISKVLVVLILAGGAVYVTGGVVYGIRRLNPSPAWFGFHEVFHACTLAAYTTHYVAVSLAI